MNWQRGVQAGWLWSLGCAGAWAAAEPPAQEPPPEAQGDTVVITATRLAGSARPTWQTLQRSTVLDMKDVLVQQPGLSVSGGAGAAQQWYVRGLGENELTFTVDGAGQSTQLFHHQSRFMFDPALLKTIAIDKGAGAASAGIGVTGGAIRMTTVDAHDLLREGERAGARIGLGAHGNRGVSGSLAGYGRAGDFDGLLMANRMDERDYEDGQGWRVPNTALAQTAWLAKLGWDVAPGQRLVLSQRQERQDGARALRLNVYGLRGLPPFDSRLAQRTTNLEYHAEPAGARPAIEANAFRMQVDEARDALGAMPATGFSSLLLAHSRARLDSSGANVGVTHGVDAHRLRWGYNLRRERIANPGATAGRGEENKTDMGLYAEGSWHWAPVTLTTGLRYDRFALRNTSGQRASGGRLNPSAAVLWEATPQLALHAAAAQASRSPRLYEAYILGLPWGDGYRLAEGIRPERAQSLEVGADWAAGPWTLAATVFRQTIRDYLGSRYDAAGDTRTQANVGTLTSPGYELAATWRQGALHARLGVTHSTPRVNGRYAQSTLDNVPTGRQWLASAGYRFAQPRVEVSWRSRWAQRLAVPLYDAQGAPAGRDAKPGYGVHDLTVAWQPLAGDALNVNLGIHNLGNTQYHSQTNFCFTDQSACLPEPGRDVRVGVNCRF